MRRNTIFRLFKYMVKYKWLLCVAILLTIGSNLFSLIGPLLSGYAINEMEFGKGHVNLERVWYYALLMIVFFILSSVLTFIQSVLMIHISRGVVYQMRKDVFDKLMELPVGYFDINQTGDIISRISYDIDTVNDSLSNHLVSILTTLITVFGSLIMMITISPKLVLIFCFTVPLSIILTKTITGKTKPLFRKRSKQYGILNGFTEEMISGVKTLKAYNQEENIIKKFDVQNNEAVESFYRAEYYGSTVGPSVIFINNLSLTLVSMFGTLSYLAGSISIGNISSFILYSRKFSGPINETANIISELQSSLAAAERVFNTMDQVSEKEDSTEAIELKNPKGDVELKNVYFGYSKDNIIINNLSLKADRGKLIAIVGPTGAGKTTIINLLMRFYDIDSGEISIDNNSIYNIKRSDLRRAYAMVLQDTWLFQGTIYDNISYGRDKAEKEEVIEAAKAARIHDYIINLPKGYDTIITDGGTNISNGQKQMITIARAMLAKTHMLILDEATSNIDTRTEIQIQKAMRKLMEDKTCFVIAHRLSTIQNADNILVVNKGEIVEIGNHIELISKKGFYYKLYQAQFE